MFSSCNLSRLVSTFNNAKVLRINRAVLFESRQKFHDSLADTFDQKDLHDSQEESKEPRTRKNYLTFVTMVGDLADEPKPLYRDGDIFGYKLRILSKKRYPSKQTGTVREHNHYHTAVCNNRACFPVIENRLRVNDQIFIKGNLINVMLTNLDENLRMSLIKVQSIYALGNVETE